MSLHPKIQAFKDRVGSSPIRKSRIVKSVEVDMAKRAASNTDERVLRQYFCIWGVKDDYGTVPIKGCFSKSINERGPNSKSTYKIVALYMHELEDTVGLPTVLEEDEIGLYAEVPMLEGVQVADELAIRHKAGVCNNGSYGFNYCWDKMEYEEETDSIIMKECELLEISFVTIGSQKGTYGVRNSKGEIVDETLIEDTDDLIRQIPRKIQLQVRNLIDRHITLAKNQPLEQRQKALEETEPKHAAVDYNYLLKNF